jgi:hypothetical protein
MRVFLTGYERWWLATGFRVFNEGLALLTKPLPLSPACLFAADAEGGGEPVGEEGGDLVEGEDDDLFHGA